MPPEPPAAAEPVAALLLRLTGVDITRCPVCRLRRSIPPLAGLTARLAAVSRLGLPVQIRTQTGRRPTPALDTS